MCANIPNEQFGSRLGPNPKVVWTYSFSHFKAILTINSKRLQMSGKSSQSNATTLFGAPFLWFYIIYYVRANY